MDVMPEELPPELVAMIEAEREREDEERLARKKQFDVMSRVIAKKRDEAVKARRACGIEKIWQEDEDYYEGIDDFNRNETRYTKPRTGEGGLQSNADISQNVNQCTAFFPITQQFVDAASARMGDILLPAGDWNWTAKKTPMPEDVYIGQGNVVDQEGVVVEQNQNEITELNSRQELEEERIKDELTECRYHAENRKVIESAAKIGTGVLKGPFPKRVKSKVFMDGTLRIVEKIVPASKEVSPWNFFPDMSCGEDIQDGEYVFERDHLSAKQLQDLIGGQGYFEEAIEQVIKEGPGKKYADDQSVSEDDKNKDRFEVWYFHGNIDVSDVGLIDDDYEAQDDEDGLKDYQSVILVLVNDTVIKGHVNPLDNGEFPYDVMCWQRREGSPFGIGVARQGRTGQQFMLSSGRALVDNMGVSAVPMIAMRRDGVEPADGAWEVTKGKVWWITDEAIRSIDEALQFKVVPSLQKELMECMALAGKMFEDATGVNFLLQGQQGSAPDTVGGMQLLHQNASALLRRIARVYDENITEPHINRYHDWHLIFGEDDEKGDLQIQAIGSSSLVEREIQAMQAQQILEMSLNPAFGLSPDKAANEVLKAWRFEPEKFLLDDEEKQQLAQQQPPPDPRIQVAEMNIQKDLQIAQMRGEADVEKMRIDTDRDAVYKNSLAQREQRNYEMRIAELELKDRLAERQERIAMLDYANKNQMNLDDIKAKLASDSMKMNLQKELATVNTKSAEQVLTPPSEPPGRAPEGQAFQR